MIHVYFSDCGFSCAFSTLLSEISIKEVIIIFTNGAFLCRFLFFMDPCLLIKRYVFFIFLLCRNSPEYYDVISTPIDLLKIQVN